MRNFKPITVEISLAGKIAVIAHNDADPKAVEEQKQAILIEKGLVDNPDFRWEEKFIGVFDRAYVLAYIGS